MKIKSDFFDYYDGVALDFLSEEPVYIRKTTVIREPKKHCEELLIGFAGQVYPCINGISFRYKEYFYKDQYFYDAARLLEYAAVNLSEKDLRVFLYGTSKYYGFQRIKPFSKWSTFSRYKEFLEKKHSFDESLGCPIYIMSADKKLVILNPMLKNYDFVKMLDPYQTFQKLEGWLNNLAAPQKEIPEMDNKTKILQHGFSLKESFRK